MKASTQKWQEGIGVALTINAARARRERLTLIQIYEELRGLGYEGGYDAVRRYASVWARNQSSGVLSVRRGNVKLVSGRSCGARPPAAVG